MSKPLISIIIPVFNGEKHLIKCFSIVDKQLYSNIEILFIDNNSIDKSAELIKRYCERKNNAKLYFCEKQGPGAARNLGMRKSKGDYFSFLDVDDEIMPNKFETQLNAFNQYPNASMVVGQTLKAYTDGRNYNPNENKLSLGLHSPPGIGFFWLRQFQHNPHISGVLIKKDIIQKKIDFPEQLFFGEDVAFFVKVGLFANVVVIDTQVSIYNRHNSSAISISNQQISINERYLEFFLKFAFPYFTEIKDFLHKKAVLKILCFMSFKLLMKLNSINDNKKNQKISDFENQWHPNYFYFYYFLFKVFPFKYANFIFEYFENKNLEY